MSVAVHPGVPTSSLEYPSSLPSSFGAQERSFNPYSDNAGTVVAISSEKFAVIAADTRQSEGFNIQTRYQPRVHQLTDRVAVGIQGFMADSNALLNRLRMQIDWYTHTHQKQPDLTAIARLVQTMLYGKRFFPYYSYVILAGIDRDGTGAVYSYDPVGSYERESCRAAGSAQSLIQPFFDMQVNGKNLVPPPNPGPDDPILVPYGGRSNLPKEKVLSLIRDAFSGATERHIEVGDGLEMLIVSVEDATPEESSPKISMEIRRSPLKKD